MTKKVCHGSQFGKKDGQFNHGRAFQAAKTYTLTKK